MPFAVKRMQLIKNGSKKVWKMKQPESGLRVYSPQIFFLNPRSSHLRQEIQNCREQEYNRGIMGDKAGELCCDGKHPRLIRLPNGGSEALFVFQVEASGYKIRRVTGRPKKPGLESELDEYPDNFIMGGTENNRRSCTLK